MEDKKSNANFLASYLKIREFLDEIVEGVDPRTSFKRSYFLVYSVKRIGFVAIGLFMNNDGMVGL